MEKNTFKWSCSLLSTAKGSLFITQPASFFPPRQLLLQKQSSFGLTDRKDPEAREKPTAARERVSVVISVFFVIQQSFSPSHPACLSGAHSLHKRAGNHYPLFTVSAEKQRKRGAQQQKHSRKNLSWPQCSELKLNQRVNSSLLLSGTPWLLAAPLAGALSEEVQATLTNA